MTIDAIYTEVGSDPDSGNDNVNKPATPQKPSTTGSDNSQTDNKDSVNVSSNNTSTTNIPQTGGNNWLVTVLISLLLLAAGAVSLIRDRKKQK